MPNPERGRSEDDQPTLAGGSAAVRTPGESSSADAGIPSDAPTLVDLGKKSSNSPPPPSLSPVGRRPTTPGEPESTPILEPQTLLGQRYEILELLGQGGMGAVYKARDREVNQLVALKVIRPDLASNPAIIERFKQELILARQVTHRNVIRIYDLAEADGVKFITMEYVEGEDLRTIVHEKKKLSPEESVEVMRQVCRALEAAHSVGVIHRDLKPQNIMRDKTGRVLVMDFGLARTLEGSGMTQTGAMVGTLEYMSPEQALSETLDQRSDLFTVGLIFYELLTGKMPFKADSALASLIKRTQERATPVSDEDHSIPGALSGIVSKCLERDPKLRYQSATELLSDLEQWQGKRAAASLAFPAVGTWAQSHWRWIGVVAAVFILAVTGLLLRDKLFRQTTAQQQVPAKPEVSLAILPFRNASGDGSLDWLGPYLADMLSTDVGQSTRVRTISSERVHQVLADLRMAPNASIDPTVLRRVAEYSSADTLVWGQFAKFGDKVRIDAALQDLKHDRSVPLKIEAESEKDVPGVVDRLAESIRQNLAVPRDVLKELKASSFQPSSKSVSALRDYNQGVQLMRDGKNLEAIKILQVAIKEDPQFALAYSRLAETDSALGYDNDAEQASRKAVGLAEQLPLAEKYLIEANHARIVKDNKKAIQAYENLSKTLPDNADVQYALGSLYRDQGDYDKARAVFSKILQADPKNIRALWQMGAAELMSGNPKAALDQLTKGLTLAIQVDNQEQKGLILLAMGVAYRLLNKPDEALSSYQESLDINTRIGQKRAMASALGSIAQVQALTGKSNLALASYNRGLQIEREIGAKKEAADTLIDLANLYLDRGQHQQALKMYKESLEIQRDAGDESNQALCLNNIGNLYLSRAENQEALTYFQQALLLREKLSVPGAIAETLHNRGIAYANLGQDEQAMSDFMRALELDRNAGDNRGAASLSHSMAFLFERQGRYGAAINAMQDALKLLRDAGDRSIELAQSLNDLGKFLAEAGRGDEAGKLLDEAQTLARELRNSSLQATILNTRGDVLFYAANVPGARAMYEQASRAASHGNQPDVVLISRINLAKTVLAEERSAAVSSEFARLMQQADALGQRQLSVECSVYLAQAMVSNKGYARARQQLEQSLGSSEKLGLRMQSARIRYLLGTSLRLSGNSAEAASQYREALRLLDEIKNEPGADHLLERSDVHTIYIEAIRWSQPAKS
jgi:tetratricopeptide (TPR) repeat protein/predicted Ser/Thr protein kinase